MKDWRIAVGGSILVACSIVGPSMLLFALAIYGMPKVLSGPIAGSLPLLLPWLIYLAGGVCGVFMVRHMVQHWQVSPVLPIAALGAFLTLIPRVLQVLHARYDLLLRDAGLMPQIAAVLAVLAWAALSDMRRRRDD